jgi:hypothetical protein
MDTRMSQKTIKTFYCKKCSYNTLRKNDYNKHLLTAKHIKDTNKIHNDVITVATVVNVADKNFKCECGKIYKYSQGLSKHKKSCNINPQKEVIEEPVKFEPTMNMFMEIIKENQEIKNLLIEQNKQNNILMNKLIEKDFITNNNNNTTNNNSNNTTNNNKFNLNFFLNETCKDAMNMKEFISNIKITFEELLNIGDTGFVSGVSDIFIKRLRDLDVSKRPIHCTDVKRDTIYLKDQDKWDKDDKENTKLKGFIGNVEYKNLAALHKWSQENPESKINNSQLNSLKNKIYLQTLLGDDDTRNKVIKNVSKLVIVDRTGEPV